MKTSITQEDLAALNRYAEVAKAARAQIDYAIDEAEALLGIKGKPRDTDIADELCEGFDVKAALRRMGIVVLRKKS